MRYLIACLLCLFAVPAFAQNPIPGYTIAVSGMKAGSHSFGHLAYNGTWCCPEGKFRTLPNGSKVYDASGLFSKNPLGAGKGLGDERMELTITQTGSMIVERWNANGLVGRWAGNGVLSLSSQGVQCECSGAVVSVSQVGNIAPYLP